MAPRVLVLGAGGFLGRAAALRLAEAGWTVVAPVRPGRSLPPALSGRVTPLRVAGGDDALAGALASVGPDAVVDAAWAGVAGPSRTDRDLQRSNVVRVGRLLDALPPATGTWLGLGSQAEYGPIDGLVGEDHPLSPATAYGRAKVEVSTLVRERGLAAGARALWLRVFASYGPGQGPGWLLPDALVAMLRDEPVLLTGGHQGADYLYVDDVADAVVALLATDTAGGTYNVGSGTSVTVRHLIASARTAAGSSSELRWGARPDPPGPVVRWAADARRLRRDTGWQPCTDLEEGLRRTVAWTRASTVRPV